jgi:PAS domain S-box-containing protein
MEIKASERRPSGFALLRRDPRHYPHTTRRFSFTPVEFLPERVALLYRLCGGDTPMILFVGAVAAFALWGLVRTPLLLAWALWLCGGSLARHVLSRVYARKDPRPEHAARWENLFCLVSAAIGSAWGVSILLAASSQPSMQELTMTFLLSSISMGLPPSLAPSPKAFASFVLPIIVPIVALLFTAGGDVNIAGGLLLLVLTGVLISIYVSANRALIATLAYGHENARLLERVRAAVQTLALAVWEWDAGTRRLHLDAAWSAMLRRHAQEATVTLEQFSALLHPDDRQPFEAAWSQCLAGTRDDFVVELRVRTDDGDWAWFLSRGRVVERDAAGRALRLVGTQLDITKRKLAEKELFAALQRKKELSEMKSKFVSIASHELRSPLATILASAEMMEYHGNALPEEQRKDVLKGIESGVRRMTALIDDVLTIGRSGSGKLDFKPVALDLQSCMQDIVDAVRVSEPQSDVALECRIATRRRLVDERLLRHIVNNLLSNAIKYSPDGSRVSVRVTDRTGEVLIEVADRGIGIPENDQALVFEGFHRGSNVGERPGTGLGLAIVKTAAELHGGRVSLQSTPGAGSRFSVALQALAA